MAASVLMTMAGTVNPWIMEVVQPNTVNDTIGIGPGLKSMNTQTPIILLFSKEAALHVAALPRILPST